MRIRHSNSVLPLSVVYVHFGKEDEELKHVSGIAYSEPDSELINVEINQTDYRINTETSEMRTVKTNVFVGHVSNITFRHPCKEGVL